MTGWTIDPWESAALSRPVARVITDGTPPQLSDAWSQGVELVYVDSSQPLASTPPDWSFVGELRELAADLSTESCPGPVPTNYQRVPIDVSRFDLGGRYELDPRLTHLSGQVYARWVDDAATTPDREVRVLDDDAGLLVTAVQADTLRIELIGVDREHRGQGLGAALIRLAFARGHAHGCARLLVGGYAHNIAAMRLYDSCGLRECSRRWRYHVHRPAGGSGTQSTSTWRPER